MSTTDKFIHIKVNHILYNGNKLLQFIERERRKNPSAKYVVLYLVGGHKYVYELDGIAKTLGVDA